MEEMNKKPVRRAKHSPAKKTAASASARRESKKAHTGLSLLFTVVDRNKAEFYLDLLQNFEVNMQMSLAAHGTAAPEMRRYLGLTETEKTVIVSVVREDRVAAAMEMLEEKFRTVRNGKGIAFSVPMSGTIGVAIYQFLSNTK